MTLDELNQIVNNEASIIQYLLSIDLTTDNIVAATFSVFNHNRSDSIKWLDENITALLPHIDLKYIGNVRGPIRVRFGHIQYIIRPRSVLNNEEEIYEFLTKHLQRLPVMDNDIVR